MEKLMDDLEELGIKDSLSQSAFRYWVLIAEGEKLNPPCWLKKKMLDAGMITEKADGLYAVVFEKPVGIDICLKSLVLSGFAKRAGTSG